MEGPDLQDDGQVLAALTKHRSIRGIARATGLPLTSLNRAVHRAHRSILEPEPAPGPKSAPSAPAIVRGTGRAEERAVRAAQDSTDAVLVFSDAHARREEGFDRFRALGRAIADIRPRAVVDLGDFGDHTEALRAHFDKRDPEGDYLLMDFDAARRARAEVTAWHRPPLLLACEGNHEWTARQMCRKTRALPSGLYDERVAVPAKAAGWRLSLFGQPVELDGVHFCHAFMGQGRRKLGGEHVASTLVRRLHASAVCGDTHRWDGPWAERTLDGRTAIGLCIGTFQDPRPTDTRAWAGCALLHRLEHGRFEVQQLSLAWLMSTYGRR